MFSTIRRLLSRDKEKYRVPRKVQDIIPVKANPRWGIGIHGGVGAGKGGITPYVGVGVQYNILSW